MLAVLGAIESGQRTLVLIAAATGLDKKTVTMLIEQAGTQAGVGIAKNGAVYSIDAWGLVLKRDGARKAFLGTLHTHEEQL